MQPAPSIPLELYRERREILAVNAIQQRQIIKISEKNIALRKENLELDEEKLALIVERDGLRERVRDLEAKLGRLPSDRPEGEHTAG